MSDLQTIRGKGDIEHTLLDAPGATGTVATSVNLFDVITGYYGNASGAHGLRAHSVAMLRKRAALPTTGIGAVVAGWPPRSVGRHCLPPLPMSALSMLSVR
jgi:hypothetical protein